MMIGLVLIGMIAGLGGLVTALLLGQSVLAALLAYMACGAAGTILVPLVLWATARPARLAGRGAPGPGHAEGAPFDWPGSGFVGAGRAMTILAVDDDPSIRRLIPRIATEAGYPGVATAGSGVEALDMLGRPAARFGCILLDVEMPGMDGIELCARIRNMPQYRQTPVIMLTARTEQSVRDRAFRAGATGYATKPFRILDLVKRLQEAEAPSMTAHGQSAFAMFPVQPGWPAVAQGTG